MPRKTQGRAVRLAEPDAGFNEAAARCHGKRQAHGAVPLRRRASMRPRPDATENGQGLAGLRAGQAASMRPRPDATENQSPLRGLFAGRRASMRPRPDATENSGVMLRAAGVPIASMRPRPDATENAGSDGEPRGSAQLQ